jgi:replicative DNA helicase
MADDGFLSGSLQETIVAALVYNTDGHTRITAKLVDLNWFEDPYREIMERVLKHWRANNEAPGEAHIDDVLDFVLDDTQHKKYNLYSRILERIARLNQTLNTNYVYNRLFEFARRQNLKRAIFEAGTILSQSTEPDDYDKVESILAGVANFQRDQYDLGFSLAQTDRSLKFLENEDGVDRITLGIRELDQEGIGPGRGELFLLIAPRGRGKSMLLHHIGRRAIDDAKWNALHITLENSAEATAQRYFQSSFAFATRNNPDGITVISKDDEGRVVEFLRKENPAIVLLNRDEQRKFINKKLADMESINDNRLRLLRIKEFPTGDLTYEKLEAFLDHLETIDNFVPGIILLDYPDLMNYDRRYDPRYGIGRLYQQLRGLAVKRHIAIVAVSQSNREGESAKLVESYHTAEDISKIATADYVLTYNQTKQEHELGVARLYVAKARNEKQWFTVLISQNYAAAQFMVEDSAKMTKKEAYTDILDKAGSMPVESEPEINPKANGKDRGWTITIDGTATEVDDAGTS